MKTLAVLSALAAVAFSAPTLSEVGHETHQTKSSQEVNLHVTGKNASPQTFNNEALHEIGNTSPLLLDESHEPSARVHLGLKKPIIIKKKLGSSHLYRSSGEEEAQADPQETCMQEVKVKLCDTVKTTTTDKTRSTITEDANTHKMDSDVEHSIKMAKEAVENLQRGLLNIEHNPDAKMSQWKHSDSESDVEMHADIEVARQALEHIQQNFGNLESMNLRASTLKDTEHLHDSTMKISESDEARLTQWKEAIDNIQKNVEIAKNIEDSFKSATHSNIDKKVELHETSTKSTKGNPVLLHKDQELHQHDADMTVSASSPVEVKIKPESTVNPLEKKDADAVKELGKSSVTEDKVITDTNIKKEKSTETGESKASENKMILLKLVDNSKKLIDSETASKSSENFIETETAPSTLFTKSVNTFKKDLEHISAKKSAAEKEKSASAWKETDEKKLLAKEAEAENSKDITVSLGKIIGQKENKLKQKFNTTELTPEEKEQLHSIGKSAEAVKTTEHLDSGMKSAAHVVAQNAQEKTLSHPAKTIKESNRKHEAMTVKAAKEAPILILRESADLGDQMHSSALVDMKTSDLTRNTPMGISVHLDNSMAPSTQTEMKAADHNILHQMENSINFHSSMSPSTQTDMKAADHHIFHPTGQSVSLDSSVAPKMPMEMKAANLHILPPTGKSVHLDSSLQPQMENMEVEGKSAMEYNKMMQWKQMQRARGAYGLGGYGANTGGIGAGASGLSGYGAGGLGGYGSSAAAAASNALNIGASAGTADGSGTGAVGVFPNANIGGCAIPLLLSCSPSVVSGRLAKSHSSGYGDHAYRMGEDFKYHFKRDTKKTNEIASTKVKRTSPKRVEKISIDKKN